MSDISSSTAIASGTTGTQLTSSSNSDMGENQFLQLMMDQLQNQDPLNPSDPTQYMSELASFSSLEQEMQISTSASTSATEQSSSTAINLIGKSVTYTASDGSTETGTVSSVNFTSSGPTLTVGSTSGIALSSITEAQ